jgi:hypothetical protein
MTPINPLQAPINYAVDVESPFEAALGGFKLGAASLEAQARAQDIETARNNQARLTSFFNTPNKTPSDYTNAVAVLPPGQASGLIKLLEMKNKEQQQTILNDSVQIWSALNNGQPEIATTRLTTKAAAQREAGDEPGALETETIINAINTNPGFARDTLGLTIAALPGGSDFLKRAIELKSEERANLEFANKQKKYEFELAQAKADSENAAVAAKYAERIVQQKLELDKLAAQIRAVEAANSRESNQINRASNLIKLEDLKIKQTQLARDHESDYLNATQDLDNFLNTADILLKTPLNVIENATGTISSLIPTVRQSTADFVTQLDTLGAQTFISQIPKIRGTGALSEAEGKKLQASLQNLSLKQSPQNFLKNLKEAKRLIEKSKDSLSIKFGKPTRNAGTSKPTSVTQPQTPVTQTPGTQPPVTQPYKPPRKSNL